MPIDSKIRSRASYVGGSSHQHQSQSYQQDLSVILVTGSYDHEIRFWEAWSGICSRTIPGVGQINRLCISPDKRFVAAAVHKKVHIYEIGSASTQPYITFDGHTDNVTSLAFQGEGHWLVTGSEDSSIRIWDMRSAHTQRNYDNASPVNDVNIHPNQGELISCDQSGSIKQWDLAENACVYELAPAGPVPIRSVNFASDGTCLVAGSNKGRVYVWKIRDERELGDRYVAVKKFDAHSKYLTKCLLSPDVKYLATCSADTTVKIWDVGENYEFKHSKTLTGHQRWVWDAAFSADSAYLVTASSDHVARLWEVASGETVRQYNGHHKAVVCCSLNDVSIPLPRGR
ncbi:WD40 repeat-like protein [Calocera cornea HHB12733]|uniref:Protein LST8 homolog n=1 Tax=Calocera cornea HHB12733 TaxID=1353952 RepID=A0A165G1R0_9BASI|nr:WD40 repeat-like protein [Calocera cornea HHB12733]